jgi:uncharacterized membrane protein
VTPSTPTDPHTATPASPARVPAPVSALPRRAVADRPAPWRGLLRGAAAGAAGTTALNAVTYLDMVVRGRPASDAPEQVVARLAGRAGIDVGGSRRERRNRFAGLGPLSGIAAGVGVGALAGLLRSAGLRLPTAVGGPLLGAAAMAASDVPLAALGVSDPRTWSAIDWVGDAVPHLVYGVVTHATLTAAAAAEEGRTASARAPLPALLRAAALGAASGSRSTLGVTAVALTSARGDRGRLASGLGSTTGTAVSGVLALGELVADKLPTTPSRLAPPALGGRVLLGGTAAVAEARRDGHDPVLPALVGAAGAVGAALLGARLRGVAAQRFGSDKPGAFVEDGVAAVLGWLGARRPAV